VRIGLFERESLIDLTSLLQLSVYHVVISWANFSYHRLGSLSIWPRKEEIVEKIPKSFKSKYKETRVFIYCTEIEVEMPSSLVLKSRTYSNFKSANTLKGLLRISPSGSKTFFSQLYTGSISDREISERFGILNMPFNQAGDSLMADKRIDIQHLLDSAGVKLNIPPFLHMQAQFLVQFVPVVGFFKINLFCHILSTASPIRYTLIIFTYRTLHTVVVYAHQASIFRALEARRTHIFPLFPPLCSKRSKQAVYVTCKTLVKIIIFNVFVMYALGSVFSGRPK